MTEVPVWRLYVLRAAYLVLAVGLGLTVGPKILLGVPASSLAQGVVRAMLAALALLSVLGLRYPLQMLPLIFFELAWKTIWLGVVAYPAWATGRMTADTLQMTRECIGIVVVPLLIPWGYVASHYIRRRGDRWA